MNDLGESRGTFASHPWPIVAPPALGRSPECPLSGSIRLTAPDPKRTFNRSARRRRCDGYREPMFEG